MRICAAQTRPHKGAIQKNIDAHRKMISLAATHQADAIFFPELSLTGYEPELAKKLACNPDDQRLDNFQQLSDVNRIIIGVGVPIKTALGIQISMVVFQPDQQRITYSKQHLHEDEHPYFVSGEDTLILNQKIAPAICYETLLPEHAEQAAKGGAKIYIASVAKSQNGVDKAFKHFPIIARNYSMTVFMANCVGHCDNFESAGKTSIWNNKGEMMGQLNSSDEGILMMDTSTEEIIQEIS